MTESTGPARAASNRLAGATSPYLLQHAGNPVDWFPWGPEALAAARERNRPIFLSIGYSACHWCHVMEEESFEDAGTAAQMNRDFVCIKVDREERPDLDDIYMTAVQLMTGSGGWPMSIWLTPELKPFYGGTYFPRDNRYGRPSFRQVLTALAEAWQKDPASVRAQAERVHGALTQHLAGRSGGPGTARPATGAGPPASALGKAVEELTSRFDSVHGGFGTAPKFPPHGGLSLLLARYRQSRDENLIRMATLTFDRMALGGMYDQVGGGFHRYSTDREWLVPHFEKMLYDNALLAETYVDAWRTTGSELYRRIAVETLDWVLREMTDPAGGFYSSLDADSEGEEGRFYVWTPQQVEAALGPDDAGLVTRSYGITQLGNFESGGSIPHAGGGEWTPRLAAARARLLAARDLRVRPHRDDKVLTAWNGLMIRALAGAGAALDEPRYLAAAARAADFLLRSARGPSGLMRVSWRAGRLHDESFLDDQAFFIRGMLALHEATGEARWLTEARRLADAAHGGFWDEDRGGYFFTLAARADLIVRAKNPNDGAIPSGNSVMADSLSLLGRLTGEPEYRRRAALLFAAFRDGMESLPGAFHGMIAALETFHSLEKETVQEGATWIVSATPRPPADPVPAGQVVTVPIQLEIADGWHINAARPDRSYLIPTSAALNSEDDAQLVEARFPDGSLSGRPTISLLLKPRAGLPAGPLSLSGRITYQACSDRACKPMARLPFEIAIRVKPPEKH